MKKIVTLVVALLVCLMAMTGCGDSTGYSNNLTNTDGAVSSNGGFAVVKGDYVYFINGIAKNTDDNTYGDVTTGALVRAKLADLKADKKSKSEMVIPSLFVAGDMTSGFYIFGNDVFYATPVNTKNKEGKVENDKLNFVKTSLNGSTSVILKTVDDKATAYRYVEKDNKVYLVTKTVNDKKETVVNIVNATDNKEVATTEKIENMIFCSENSAEVYYTKVAYNENLEEDEKFNEIHRLTVEGKDEIVYSGVDMMSDLENGFGISGAKFSFIKDTANTLYVKVDYVETPSTPACIYYAIEKSKLSGVAPADLKDAEKQAAAKETLKKNKAGDVAVAINYGTATAADIFTENSLYVKNDLIIYLDKTYGVCLYNYTKMSGEGIVDGRQRLFSDKLLSTAKVKFWQDGYLYMTKEDGKYVRLNVAALVDFATGAVKSEKVALENATYILNAGDWYLPEVIDGAFLSVYTQDPYGSMVYAQDIDKIKDLDEEGLKKLTETTEENTDRVLSTGISILTTEKQEAIDKYKKDTFKKDNK